MLAFGVVLGGACDSSPPAATTNLPPALCKAPPSTAGGFPWFQEVTADVGLAGLAATTVMAVDVNGDGWADLLTMGNSATRGKQPAHLFLNQADPNTGARVFVDAIQASGLLATRDGANNRGFDIANAGDVNDDGFVDIILCSADEDAPTSTVKDPCDAFLNDGTGHFTLAPTSDLDSKIHWVPSASLLDYDQDGYLDFWPGTVAHWPYDPTVPNTPPTLFRGNGDGTFTNVSAQVGLPTKDGTQAAGTQWRHVFGVVACDIDGDGDDDMIFADYGREENQVWRNDNGTFTNVAHDLGIDHDDRVNFDDDQSYRCYCEQVAPGSAPCMPAPPAPTVDCCGFANLGSCPSLGGPTCPGTNCPPWFRGWEPGVTDQAYNLGGNYFSFACGDMNNDGTMDLVSATIVHADVGSSSDPTELILNPVGGGKFTRPGNETDGLLRAEPPMDGVYWTHGDNLMMMPDVDLDGLKDLFSTPTGAYGVADTHRLWRQVSLGQFQEIEYQAGLLGNGNAPILQGAVFVDIDGDGDLDVVAGQTDGAGLHVYRNLVGQNNNWTRIRLVGGGAGAASTSAIGAVVHVTAGGKTQTQYMSGGYGHGNVESDLVLTFGLGSSCAVDQVEVHWPDAAHSVSTFTNVLPNYNVTIRQGGAEVVYAH